MYDLLVAGGRVIDPAQDIDATMDVAISGDRIAKVARDIPRGEGRQVVDARDKIVTPGLIDLHAHVYDGVHKVSTDPDTAGVTAGVTTVVDGGSAGQAIFAAFRKYVIPAYRTRVFCFLHLGSTALCISPEIRDWAEIDFDATVATIAANREIIKGVKLRMVGKTVASAPAEVVKLAQKAARQFGLPIMVHIGDVERQVAASATQELLRLMEPGDILSHCFTGQQGAAFGPDGAALPELKEAKERGVVLDVARGKFNFSFEMARRGLAQGILPTTISTDLTSVNLPGPVFGLTVTMSVFLTLGLNLRQVVEMTTINPARALRVEDSLGSLKPGAMADVSILEQTSGKWSLLDSAGQALEATTLIVPRITVKSGQVITAQPKALPKAVE
ncbi:MAG: amidohydrolase/deacetylase family metallohydrolase [Chloroflexi bacterium]|nr:amidohydrolase/deacetylase family metallohydrolase [Chloroflexota bacterium]